MDDEETAAEIAVPMLLGGAAGVGIGAAIGAPASTYTSKADVKHSFEYLPQQTNNDLFSVQKNPWNQK